MEYIANIFNIYTHISIYISKVSCIFIFLDGHCSTVQGLLDWF